MRTANDAAVAGFYYASTAVKASPVGTYPITSKSAKGANYTITFVNGTLTVTSP